MMKLLKSISLISAIIFFSMNLYSQEINSSQKNRLLIYNFITTDNYDSIKDKEKNYQYYSIVIPETITKNLGKSKNYDIRREAGPFSIEADFPDKKEKRKYIQKLEELGLQNKSDYVITGTFNVVNKKLTIRVTIFDVNGKDIKTFDHESDELGVRMQQTPDIISQLISENIESFNKLNQEKSDKTGLYSPFSIITIGLDSGYLYLMGDWSSTYNNAFYISPFIDFELFKDFNLSLKATSIQCNSNDNNTSSYSNIRMLSGSISLSYLFRFSDNSGIALSAGGGMTKTTIAINPDKPFSNTTTEEDSFDPNVDLSSYLVYNLSTFTLRAGVLYKRIFFEDEPIDTGVIFAGAGIHF